jgi:hypothetical protein
MVIVPKLMQRKKANCSMTASFDPDSNVMEYKLVQEEKQHLFIAGTR